MTAILMSDLVGGKIEKKYVPELSYNRLIVGRTLADGTYETGSADLGETPYLEKYMTIPEDNTSDLDDYAAAYLANMREGWQQYTLGIFGITPRLLQTIDLESIQSTLSIVDSQHVYRISDILSDVDGTGGVTSMTLISADYKVLDENSRISMGDSTSVSVTDSQTAALITEKLSRTGEITATGTGTVTITYEEGDTETISTRGVS